MQLNYKPNNLLSLNKSNDDHDGLSRSVIVSADAYLVFSPCGSQEFSCSSLPHRAILTHFRTLVFTAITVTARALFIICSTCLPHCHSKKKPLKRSTRIICFWTLTRTTSTGLLPCWLPPVKPVRCSKLKHSYLPNQSHPLF